LANPRVGQRDPSAIAFEGKIQDFRPQTSLESEETARFVKDEERFVIEKVGVLLEMNCGRGSGTRVRLSPPPKNSTRFAGSFLFGAGENGESAPWFSKGIYDIVSDRYNWSNFCISLLSLVIHPLYIFINYGLRKFS
jgi:hypothetical protein